MSYILDALKKSDQQRNLGTPPTLQFAQASIPARKRPSLFFYGLLAVVLLAAGVAIGLLRPWQAEQISAEIEPVSPAPPVTISRQAAPAPLAAPPEMPAAMKPIGPSIVSSGTPGAAAPIPDKSMPDKSAFGKSPSIAGVVQEQKTIPFDELPVQIQREIPAMTVQLHSYSNKPGEGLVYINSSRLREGESLIPGLRLEQVTPDGMIFSYMGYRFQHGIR